MVSIPEELLAIVDRFTSNTHTDADRLALQQLVGGAVATGTRSLAIRGDANGATIATGDGNTILHITFQADGLRVGESIYQGDGTDVLRSLLQDFLQPKVAIDWQQVSRSLLEERLQLTTNPMTRGEDIAYQVEQVYVPLGLMERKKVPRRSQDSPPEQGSLLYQEDGQPERSPEKSKSSQDAEQEQAIEITQRFEHGQFLEQVLQQGQSPKSQGKRIAVIGEPGAGKTTLLQQIARWAAATFPDAIVIWISLADLQNDSLETYLEKRWLQRIIRTAGGAEPSPADKTDFSTQFKQGRVWLLLDGLDEMQVSGNPLTEIQRQLQEGGWLQQARILLTCRLNLWDGDRNALTQFDTYRTLEFAYPDQVEQFIHQWFAPRSKAALGEALCAALKESGRERIRDLVKNPLRLTLLCFNWYLQQGQLPETQAELYQRFVDRIYEWKQEQFPTTLAQREHLNQALAQLSLAAINDTDTQRQTRFRLRQSFVNRVLQRSAAGETPTLLDLALKIGWLNQVGVDADDPTQAVYAFYHPTFEEYFAALGIDDGRFFLNPVPRNPMAKNASYQIFEPQWRQVFLLWLGRKDVDKAQKDGLIGAMMKFKDRCGGFYSDRAFLLAATGIAEFKDCTYADAIVSQLVQWKFGHANGLKQLWADLFDSTRGEARADWATTTFSSTDAQRVVRALVRLVETTPDEDIRWRAAESLGNIGMGNETAIRALVRLEETTQFEYIRERAAESLGKIDPGNETAIRALVRVLETTQFEYIRERAASSLGNIDLNEYTRERAAESLGTIAPGDETAIRALVRVLETSQSEYTRRRAAESLGTIDPGNETAIRALVRLVETSQNAVTRMSAVESLGKIDSGNETAIRALVRVLETSQSEYTRWRAAISCNIAVGNETAIRALVRLVETSPDEDIRRTAAESLGTIAPGNETAIRALLRLVETTPDEDIRWRAVESLGEIGTGNETTIRALVRLVETSPDEYTRKIAAYGLGTIAPGNETAIRALVRLVEITPDEYTRRIATDSLGKIAPGNETAIRALLRLVETSPDEDIRRTAAESLGKIGTGNETAIWALVRLVETTQNKDTRWRAVDSLGKIAMGNETAIRALVRLVETSPDEYTPERAADSLGKIDPGNETAIWALVRLVETAQKDTRWRAAESLGTIAPGNETAIRALLRLVETSPDEDIRRIAAESLGKIGTGNETAIRELVRVLETIPDESTRRIAAESLGKIGMNREETIRVLVRSLRRHLRTEETYQLMIKCAEILSYPNFFQAFHSRR